jgi:hypothetical protein
MTELESLEAVPHPLSISLPFKKNKHVPAAASIQTETDTYTDLREALSGGLSNI